VYGVWYTMYDVFCMVYNVCPILYGI